MTINISEKNKEEFKALGVAAVYLFGSLAEGKNGPLSDIDLAILLENEARSDIRSELYQSLYNMFSDIFDLSDFKHMDIVFLDRAPLELSFDVIKNGQVIFDAKPDLRNTFESRVSLLYVDFQPLLRDFDKNILSRL